VLPGITPGSGPGHLGLFGYDPLEYRIGRGILEALGINFEVGPRDVAVRGNFCTVDEAGKIGDRRAGRPTTERCVAMCKLLQGIEVPGLEVFVEPVREHRFVVVFRGDGLGDALKGHAPTNMVTLRGFSRYPKIDTVKDIYGLKAVAIAVYPMYRGLARLVGMDIADAGSTLGDQVERLRASWHDYDFFFLHYKYTDSTGEDGNFAAKVEMIERLDAEIPKVRGLNPDVLIVTGDHSTPSRLRSHSWHPVPTVLWARTCRPDGVTEFGESQCLRGGLGQFQAMYLLPMAMAHALRLGKYGA
jgi:2,3-bisphosphoglycerate-independent phosphoglycerate mutase